MAIAWVVILSSPVRDPHRGEVKSNAVRYEGDRGPFRRSLWVSPDEFLRHRKLRCTDIVAVVAELPDSTSSGPSCNSIKRWEVDGSRHICE